MRLGKISGIPLTFNPFFLLVLVVAALGGYLLETLLHFTVIFLHELAHVLVARGFGLEIKGIELYPFGGVAKLEGPLELDSQAEKNVALAGPVANFILAGAALVLYSNNIYTGASLLFFVRLNLMLGLFNLLPALPLDGGRILRATLAPSFGFRKATEYSLHLAKFFAWLLLVVGLFFLFSEEVDPSLFIVGLFLLFAVAREEQNVVYRFIRYLIRKREDFEENKVLPVVYLAVREDASLKEIVNLFRPKKYHLVLILDETQEVVKIISETEIIEKVLQEGISLRVGKLIK